MDIDSDETGMIRLVSFPQLSLWSRQYYSLKLCSSNWTYRTADSVTLGLSLGNFRIIDPLVDTIISVCVHFSFWDAYTLLTE